MSEEISDFFAHCFYFFIFLIKFCGCIMLDFNTNQSKIIFEK